MPATPWTTTAELDARCDYLVVATRFVATRHLRIPQVVRATQAVWSPLAASDGLLGYSMEADFLRRTLSTLSVWRGRDELTAFVRGEAHAAVVARTRPWLRDSIIVTWPASGMPLPPTWETARRQLAKGVTTPS